MRKYLLTLALLLATAIPVWCQNPFNVTITSTGGTAVTTNVASATVTIRQTSGTQVSYTVFDACLSGGKTTVGAGAPYTFTGAVCGAGYATSTTVGTVQLSSGPSVTFQVSQQVIPSTGGASSCSGLSDSGTGCSANAGTGASDYAAGNDSRITSAVPNTRQVNGHALSGDVSVTNADLGATPTSTTVCGHALSSNVSCSNSDVGLGSVTNDVQAKASTTVCGHALSSNVSCSASDVGLGNVTNDAQAKAATTVAGHPLSANVTIACGDLSNGAASCSTDATNAGNIATGTLNAARLPALGVPLYSVRTLPVALLSYTIQTSDDKKTIKHAPTSSVAITLPQPAASGSPFVGKTVNAACTATSTTCTVTRTVTAGNTVVVGVQYENVNTKVMPTLVVTDNKSDSFSTTAAITAGAGTVTDELAESHAFTVTGGSTVFTVTCSVGNACTEVNTIWAVYVTEYTSNVSSLDGTVQTNAPSAGQVPSVSVTTNFANDMIWLENYSRAGCTSFVADNVPSFTVRDDFNGDSGRCGGIYDGLFPGAAVQNIQFSSPSVTWPPQTLAAAFKTTASQTFLAGFSFVYTNQGTANITITPTSSTISTANASAASSIVLFPGQSIFIISDGANYQGVVTQSSSFISTGQQQQTISGADYTNTSVTPSTLFSWTLPATPSAQKYRFSCDIMWESTAATLVGPVFGVNISAAPTQLTAAAAVQNTLAGADINGYLSNTTTGSQTLVTSSAAGVTSTNYWAKIWGTIEGAAVAGSTFIINAASTSGTTASLNIRRGSGCTLY